MMRLNKYIASSGVTSRRKADQLIFEGKVKVNGKIVTEPWFDVDEKKDVVEVNGKRIKPIRKKLYLKLYKPAGYETRIEKQNDLPALKDLYPDLPEGVFPVGRLDARTEGLVLLTNDGEFSYIMTHPKFKIPRRYKIKIWGKVSDEDLDIMVRGVEIGGGEIGKFDAISPIRILKNTSWYELVVHEGKYHEIRKMFGHLGYKILRLIRVSFGEIYLYDMKKGELRKFSKEELNFVREIKKLISER